jgi:heme/copper-type cytochrome/quinol oxidase subunit 4
MRWPRMGSLSCMKWHCSATSLRVPAGFSCTTLLHPLGIINHSHLRFVPAYPICLCLVVMTSLTRLAKTSIILNWLVVGLACSSTIVHLIWLLRIRKSRPRVADICVWLALFFGIVLVAQTTWAIVDEGSGRHQWDVSQQNMAAIAKVRDRVVHYGGWADIGVVFDYQ